MTALAESNCLALNQLKQVKVEKQVRIYKQEQPSLCAKRMQENFDRMAGLITETKE